MEEILKITSKYMTQAAGKMESSFTVMGKIGRRASFGGKARSSVLDMLS